MPKTNAAPHAATSATDATTTRPISLAVMIATLGQNVGSSVPPWDDPGPNRLGHQVRLLYPNDGHGRCFVRRFGKSNPIKPNIESGASTVTIKMRYGLWRSSLNDLPRLTNGR